MRLIDADAMKEDINAQAQILKLMFKDDVDGLRVADMMYEGYMAQINKMPTLEPTQQWIPCSERLPETETIPASFGVSEYRKSKMVIVSGDFDYGEKTWVACYCDDLDGYTYWSDAEAMTIKNVTAWMPLPEPYKEGEQDG